ncbi:TPA: prepilin-type N-terminal cleavage/methylation domain-containing protein [Clostridium perfringens]|uniref:prepilin-type N-terminal cleavage/methylation domain-containing protein n=1 Tax=Clostridium perfringens TaxID=1502 RepID=UPI0018E42B39|nr:prepilin-type N-terminal cleavage/methylation domain-containing protein [Clostridium perfringens]EGT0012996.1 prepilin-type N-terminal cleavage/methylation domain-containing protein [Clostridium perfringens]MBI6020696.1 prepilin-type N-terminal cleavage/methylation domain-containing protein [Clostridium perfringens]MBO3389051.1 prepilin-type N-terminal cleavage/methylation domain-containing protein [Clostridium perfringens]MBO3414473.1 prepilin-type N-terminal cleavage/methylation domain-con
MNTKKQNKKKKGFTLIELIVVIAIIAILAAIAIPNYLSIQRDSKVKADVTSAKSIYDATSVLIAQDKITATNGKFDANILLDEATAKKDEKSKDIVNYLANDKGIKALTSQSINGGNFEVCIRGTENEPKISVYVKKPGDDKFVQFYPDNYTGQDTALPAANQ